MFRAMEAQAIFDAVTDATRRRILALLVTEGELCVCELTCALGQIQPKISRHLGVLKALNLVQPRREGTWMFYRLRAGLPRWVSDLLAALADGAVAELRSDRQQLAAMANRPERCSVRPARASRLPHSSGRRPASAPV
jgi:ArsR family transcriptional regulator